MLEFEWDEEKEKRNLAKHGIAFEEAKAVFRDHDRLEAIDDRTDYGEERVVVIGASRSLMLAVVYTLRQGVVRIISARQASREERDDYDANKTDD